MATPFYRPKFDLIGRPDVVLTAEQYDQIEEMSVFHCSTEEMAHALGVDRHTFQHLCRRQPEIDKRIAIGRSKGKRALRSVQWKVALSGNVTMLMYLGKCILGQVPDAQVHIGNGQTAAELSEQAKAHLAELALAINKAAIAESTREVESEVISERGSGNGNGNGNVINMS